MVNLNLLLAPFHLPLSQVVAVGGEPVGALDVGDVSLRIDGGRAYVEKDWGSKFPKTHVWVQAELRGTYLSSCFLRWGNVDCSSAAWRLEDEEDSLNLLLATFFC